MRYAIILAIAAAISACGTDADNSEPPAETPLDEQCDGAAREKCDLAVAKIEERRAQCYTAGAQFHTPPLNCRQLKQVPSCTHADLCVSEIERYGCESLDLGLPPQCGAFVIY